MDITNSFDTAIDVRFRGPLPLVSEVTGRSSDDLKSAAIFVADTVDLAHKINLAVFGSKAKPEITIEIFRLIVGHLKEMPLNRQTKETAIEPYPRMTYEWLVRKSAEFAPSSAPLSFEDLA